MRVDPTHTPDVIRALSTGPLASVEWRGSTTGELLQRQTIIGVAGDGTWSERTLVPHTAAAARLLTGEVAPRFERAIRGALGALDSRAGAAGQRGLMLGSSTNGSALNANIAFADSGLLPLPSTPAALVEALEGARHVRRPRTIGPDGVQLPNGGYLPPGTRIPGGAMSQNLGGWLNLGAPLSRDLLRLVRGHRSSFESMRLSELVNPGWEPPGDEAEAMGTMLGFGMEHQLNHEVSPATLEALVDERTGRLGPLNSIEEGTAEVLAHWPGIPQHRAIAMGLPFADGTNAVPPDTGYPEHAAEMRRIFELAGIDTTAESSFPHADELLQGSALRRVPGMIADAIIERHDLPSEDRETLRRMLRDSALDRARVDEILAYVERLRSL